MLHPEKLLGSETPRRIVLVSCNGPMSHPAKEQNEKRKKTGK